MESPLAYLRSLIGLLNLVPLASFFSLSRLKGLSTLMTIVIIIIIIAAGTLVIYFLLSGAPGSSTITISYP